MLIYKAINFYKKYIASEAIGKKYVRKYMLGLNEFNTYLLKIGIKHVENLAMYRINEFEEFLESNTIEFEVSNFELNNLELSEFKDLIISNINLFYVWGVSVGLIEDEIISSNKNSLLNKYPDIAKEWHPDKNDNLNPRDFSYKVREEVWWKCSKGHEWKSTIASRTIEGEGCPICNKDKIIFLLF